MKNKKLNEIITDKVMEIPKVCFMLGGIGFLIILYSFITLSNPFFLVTGVFAEIVFFYWAYDYWYKKLNDKTIQHLSKRLDTLCVDFYNSKTYEEKNVKK